jgi:23S rRNA (guanosine2251-2'-O)-methyltransferase
MKEFIYSRNAVYEALRARRREVFKIQVSEGAQEKGRLAEILRMAKESKIPVERIQRGRLDKIHQHHQGVAAEVGEYIYSDILEILDSARAADEQPFILLLDSLNDPQNFGTLLRTAEAVGVHGVVIPLAHTVEVTPAVVNASSGASEYLRVARSNLAQAIDALKEENIWVVGLDQDGETIGEKTRRHLTGATALVVGSEGEGIRQLTRSKCDIVLQLPMRGQIESLNDHRALLRGLPGPGRHGHARLRRARHTPPGAAMGARRRHLAPAAWRRLRRHRRAVHAGP